MSCQIDVFRVFWRRGGVLTYIGNPPLVDHDRNVFYGGAARTINKSGVFENEGSGLIL